MTTVARMVKSVEHALDIVDEFTANAPFLTLAGLKRRLDLSKSTITSAASPRPSVTIPAKWWPPSVAPDSTCA